MDVTGDTLDRYEDALRRVLTRCAAVETTPAAIRAESLDTHKLADAGDFVDEDLERAVDDYLRESATVESQFLSGLTDSEEPPDAAAAWSRTISLIGGDLLVARRLAEIAAQEGEQTPDLRLMADLAPPFAGVSYALRSDLADEDGLSAVLAGLRGQEPILGSQAAPGFNDVTTAMNTILDTSGAMLARVVGAAIPSGDTLDDIIAAVLGSSAGGWFADARRKVTGFFKRVVRKILDLFEAALKKLAALFGADKVDDLIDQARDGVKQFRDGLPGADVAGEVLGVALDAASLRTTYERAFDALPEHERASRAVAATRVAKELSSRVSHVGFGVGALAFVRATPFGSTPIGAMVVGLVGLAIAAYVFWAAHDHLDALRFAGLPDRAIGLRRALA